jgi:hypothetical protein
MQGSWRRCPGDRRRRLLLGPLPAATSRLTAPGWRNSVSIEPILV